MKRRTTKNVVQVSLKTAVLILSCVAVYLSLIAGIGQIAWPLLFVTTAVAGITFLLMYLYHWARSDGVAQSRPVGSLLLMAVSVWTIGCVVLGGLKVVPGGFGPVQYAGGNSLAVFIFEVRIATLLIMVVAPFISSLIGAIRLSAGMHISLGWLIVGASSYVIAWGVLFWNLWFIPTV